MIISKRGGNGVLYNGMQRQQQVFVFVEWQRISSSYYVQHTCVQTYLVIYGRPME